jgi:SAM-dependent methyltransferase
MPTKTSAALPLIAYAEALCDKSRVLVVGDSSSDVARALVERGARLVHVCDSNPARRAETAARTSERVISFGGLDDGPATLRDSFFDLCLVENLALEADPGHTLKTIKRLLAPRGVALVATPNRDSERPLIPSQSGGKDLDYYSLYDHVIAEFPAVRMLGQVPFAGYAIVDFSSEGEPSPVLDTSLVSPRGEEPDYYVALAGRERRALEQYVVVELPIVDLSALHGAERPAVVSPDAGPELEKKLRQQEHWITELEGRAATADERADVADERADAAELRAITAEQLADTETQRADAAERVLGELKLKLETLDRAWNEERAGLVRERAQPQAELDQTRARVAEHERALTAKTNELQALAAKTNEHERALTAKTNELQALAAKTNELQALAADDESVLELSRLEAQLRERGEHVQGLERALSECERIGRELVRKLRGTETGEATQALAERLALAEADIVSLRWSLALSRSGAGRAPGEAGSPS